MKASTLALYTERLVMVRDYLNDHLDEALDPEAIAAMIHVSLPHFHRVFKAVVGETLGEYVKRLRLERAAVRLSYERQPVTKCAFDAGYETVESFSRAFKSHFGSSPSSYKKDQAERHLRMFNELDIERAFRNAPKIQADMAQMDDIQCVFVQHIGPYLECDKAWDILCPWAAGRGLMTDQTEFFGISYDDPTITPAQKIRYDACIRVDRPIECDGLVGFKTIPASDYVHTRHIGPYEMLEQTYTQLVGMWMPQHSTSIGSPPSLEFYRNDPQTTPPEELIVDIYILIES